MLADRPHLARLWSEGPEHQYGRSARFHHQLQEVNAARAWEEVSVPTLAIWGEADLLMHRRDHERLVALVNRNGDGLARLLTVPGMDCGMRVPGPDGRPLLAETVFTAIRKFLASVLSR